MPFVELTFSERGVATLTLDDPDRRNAMSHQMAEEMLAAADTIRQRDDVRAVVVTGRGKAFCAGADLPELFGDADRAVGERQALLQRYYRAFLVLRELPMPTIAAVQGAAIGAGLNLAMVCDVRIAGPHAKFGATFAKIGLHPGGGCTWFLVRALGRSRALTTLLLGDILDAQRAAQLGLCEGPEEDCVAAATELAERFASVDAKLATDIKRAVDIAVETDDLRAVIDFESWAQASSASSPTLRAWVDKFR